MISAFGPWAQVIASRLPELDAIVTDEANLVPSFVEAVRRRAAGTAFYGMLLLEEPVDRTLRSIGAGLIDQIADVDQRFDYLMLAARGDLVFNDRKSAEILAEKPIADPSSRGLAAEFLRMCPAMLVRSAAEERRLRTLLPRARPTEYVVTDVSLPVVTRSPGAPSVVVWGADRPGVALSYLAIGLHDLQADRTFVTSDGVAPYEGAGLALRAGDPRTAEVLARASCVVVAEATEPGPAIAFARAGYAVVAPEIAGVGEFVRDASTYDVLDPRDYHAAVASAFGRASSLRALHAPPSPQPHAPRVPREHAPLVSIIVPTYNRRDELAACLTSIGTQHYPFVEAVVVNDAGEKVDDVVARFPFARLIDLAQNGGVNRAMMRGLAAARGAYVQFLADDDRLFPDHVDRLMAAMLASGAAIAHGNTLIHYAQRRPDGVTLTTGYNASVFVETVSATEALTSSPIAGHGLVWRKDVFDAIGPWREDCALADQEVQLRAAQRYVFAWVDQMTAEWRIRDGENFSSKINPYAEQRRIYEELHPTTRPKVRGMRERVLDIIKNRPPGTIFAPTLTAASTTETPAGRS
jgi:hypothetical protein